MNDHKLLIDHFKSLQSSEQVWNNEKREMCAQKPGFLGIHVDTVEVCQNSKM